MKKVLDILTVMAMVLSMSTFAFAQEIEVCKLTVTDGEQSRIQFHYAEGEFVEGAKVEILINLPNILEQETGTEATVRNLTARVYGAGEKWTDEKTFDETWVEFLGNDWYKITFEVTAESEGITMGFFYFYDDGTESGKEVKPADGSVIYFASMSINGVELALDADLFEGSNLVLEAEKIKMTSPYSNLEPTDDTSGDITDDTETDKNDNNANKVDDRLSVDKVWIITGAVVGVALIAAVAAIILKKKNA